MGNYTVIADTSRSIIELLRAELSPEPVSKAETIGLAPPNEPENYTLCLNLYNIEENPGMHTAERLIVDNTTTKDPPMSLTLHYMLFANIKSDPVRKAIDEQRIMARAIQVLNDNRRVPEKYIQGTLRESQEGVDIVNVNLNLEEKVRIWSLYNQPFKVCMFYKAGPVFIESNNVYKATRVSEAVFKTEKVG